jgi:hypothetical protein
MCRILRSFTPGAYYFSLKSWNSSNNTSSPAVIRFVRLQPSSMNCRSATNRVGVAKLLVVVGRWRNRNECGMERGLGQWRNSKILWGLSVTILMTDYELVCWKNVKVVCSPDLHFLAIGYTNQFKQIAAFCIQRLMCIVLDYYASVQRRGLFYFLLWLYMLL